MRSLFGLDPSTYEPHWLHDENRSYPETNCYADVLIELVHSAGRDPMAMLGATLSVDFEGDQWTFFKPRLDEVELLYGIDVHEMQPYRPLPEQIAEQLADGRSMIVELDAFHLPDVDGTSYRSEHVKTSVAVEAIDLDEQVLHYFHNRSLFRLDGSDFVEIFRLARPQPAELLPPYVELVRFDAATPLGEQELQEAALGLLAGHVRRMPRTNPFERFGHHLESVLESGFDFHAYAFATVRLAGAAFELAGDYLRWLPGDPVAGAVDDLASVVDGCKRLSFKLARRKAFDVSEPIRELSSAWDGAREVLEGLGSS